VSRHRSPVPGLLCVGEAALAEEFGWSLDAFRKAFAEAMAEGLVEADWKARVVWIFKAWKYNSPESPNVIRSWRIPWDETPECRLKVEIYQSLKAFVEGLKDGFKKAFRESCRMPSPNQEPEPEPEPEPEEKAPQGFFAHDLLRLLKVAVEREQPKAGMWNPGQWGPKDARQFLEAFGTDLTAAIPEIERRILLFSKDPAMVPWTVSKFAKEYNGIGTSTGEKKNPWKPASGIDPNWREKCKTS
jgi:hypothetical protein